MSVIELIGFIILMVASLILSFKKGPNKSVAAESFEDMLIEDEPKHVEAPQHHKKKKLKHKHVVPPPMLSPKKEEAFVMHHGAFDIKKEQPSEGRELLEKLDSLQQAIVIQEIFNKPKGML